MSPDELFTRVFRQRADLVAVQLALDALMTVLPPEQQEQWLRALRTLAAMRAATLAATGAAATTDALQSAAIDRQIARLEAAPRAMRS